MVVKWCAWWWCSVPNTNVNLCMREHVYMYVYTPCPRLTRRGYTYSFVIERSEIEQASEKDRERERERGRRRKRRRRGRSRVRAGETIFIGSLERVSCPSRLSPQPVCDLRERNVAAAVASLGRRCIGIVGFARGAYVSSRAREKEREREREREKERERESAGHTQLLKPAGRPAGARYPSLVAGWLAAACAVAIDVYIRSWRYSVGSRCATVPPRCDRLPESRFPLETQGRVAPRRIGSERPALSRISTLSMRSRPTSMARAARSSFRTRRMPRLPVFTTSDISSVTARASAFHPYVM